MSKITTKQAILTRVQNEPTFEVVPEHAMLMFDRIIEETETEALLAHPDDVWGRVEFWKEVILDKIPPGNRGQIAGQFHEYVAALLRNEDEVPNIPYYGGEARAQRDAYLACTASLD
jgi:hypothetical protein